MGVVLTKMESNLHGLTALKVFLWGQPNKLQGVEIKANAINPDARLQVLIKPKVVKALS